MLTYDINKKGETPLYIYIYKCIKEDILSGRLSSNDKLPSKRSLAENLSVSVITIQNAYEELLYEGYIVSVPKKGYYVADIEPSMLYETSISVNEINHISNDKIYGAGNDNLVKMDFCSNLSSYENLDEVFPFSTWAKLMRKMLLDNEKEILNKIDGKGLYELRAEISKNLKQYRGLEVNPDNIIIGAGMEYLYGLLVQLLGRTRMIAVEDPGHTKVHRIYESNGVKVLHVPIDEHGMKIDIPANFNISAVHISPSHHFPTGVVMPASRRHKIINMAKSSDMYVIEDDYDSEFRFAGHPVPAMYEMDKDVVIYMNTFSKSLMGAVRIAYMVLPDRLLEKYNQKLDFYSCTVSKVEQYTLASFIHEEYYERHIYRMRLKYKKCRKLFLDVLNKSSLSKITEVIENNSGLHFILKINSNIEENKLRTELLEKQIKISFVSDYCNRPNEKYKNMMIINYFETKESELLNAFEEIYKTII